MRRRLIFPGALGDVLLLAPAALGCARAGDDVEISVTRALQPIVGSLFALGPPADSAAMATLFGDTVDTRLGRWLAGAARVDAWLGVSGRSATRHCAALGIGAWHTHAVVRDDGG